MGCRRGAARCSGVGRGLKLRDLAIDKVEVTGIAGVKAPAYICRGHFGLQWAIAAPEERAVVLEDRASGDAAAFIEKIERIASMR